MEIEAQIKKGINSGIIIIERYSVLLSKYNLITDEQKASEHDIISTDKLAVRKKKNCRQLKEYNNHIIIDIIRVMSADSKNTDNCFTMTISKYSKINNFCTKEPSNLSADKLFELVMITERAMQKTKICGA
jgi:hypothetical protein